MRISVQTGGLIETYGAEKTAKFISEAGFTGLDWGINRGWDRATIKELGYLPQGCIYDKSDEEIDAYWKEQSDAWKKYGLQVVQAHAPYPAYVFGNPDFLDYAIAVNKKCIRYCERADIPYLVLHGISLPCGEKRLTQEDVEALNMKLYTSLIPVLRETGVVVCLENLFSGRGSELRQGHCADPNEAVRHIDLLNEKAGKECFGLCLDTGHLHILHGDVRTYVRTLGKRIKVLHLHDNDGSADQHLGPYAGTFPWADLIEVLREIGYEGDLNFETFAQVRANRTPEAMIPETLRFIRAAGEYFRSEIQK